MPRARKASRDRASISVYARNRDYHDVIKGKLKEAAGFLAASALALMGIAVSNVLMPVIVKRWFPDRVGSMTGLYSMALALGTSAAAAVTAASLAAAPPKP